ARVANRELVVINCAAIPEHLAESELFGHERGAFTGANARRIGLIEAAGNNVILFDEIGKAPLIVQGKLLRVIEERELTRVGGNAIVPIKAPFIFACSESLEELVRTGVFFEDLYNRIKTVRITTPALKDRREDIPAMVRAFAANLDAE